MTVRLACPHCHTQFAAPTNSTTSLVGCPVCQAVLSMPTSHEAAPSHSAKLLEQIVKADAAVASAAIIKPAKARATAIPAQDLHQPDQGGAPPAAWQWLAEWGLVAAVLAVSLLGLVADVKYLRTGVVTFVSLAGMFLGGLSWRTQLLEKHGDDENARWLESHLGLCVAYTGLGLCSIHFVFFIYCVVIFAFTIGWHESMPPLVGGLALFLAMNIGLAMWLHSLFERFGFYRAMSWIYVLIAGVLPMMAVLAGTSIRDMTAQFSIDMFNPRTLLNPAERELTQRGYQRRRSRALAQQVAIQREPARALTIEPALPAPEKPDLAPPAHVAAPPEAAVPEAAAPAVATNDPPREALAEPVPAAPRAMPAPPAAIDVKPLEPPLRTNRPHILSIVEGRRVIVPTGRLVAPETRLTPGTEIQVEFQNRWNLGRVVEVLPEGDVRIIWLDGDKDVTELVPRHRIRLDLAKEGPAKAANLLEIAKNNRLWIDAQGNVVNAKFISCDGVVLRLRTAEGRVIAVPFDGLSLTDQELVREIVAAKMEEREGEQQ